jgi:plasminogen activator inhibitor 1 RNA-binding protein
LLHSTLILGTNVLSDHQKQVGHGWGEATGQGEWQDEKAGEAIATEEKKEDWDAGNDTTSGWKEDPQSAPAPENGTTYPEAEPEPEDNSKSYADYLAEQATKKLGGLGLKEARAPNEGSKENKKWKSAKELQKGDDEDYFKGEEKAGRQRDRTRNAKETVDIDYAFKEQSRDVRGGRGGGRGGRGRGGGDRGDFRGRGRGRGDFRGDFRGGRGRGRSDGAGVAVDDETAFPSLGGK